MNPAFARQMQALLGPEAAAFWAGMDAPRWRALRLNPLKKGALELTLPCGTESLNPGLLTEALRALPGMDGTPCRIRRLEVYGSDGEPFR